MRLNFRAFAASRSESKKDGSLGWVAANLPQHGISQYENEASTEESTDEIGRESEL